MYFHVSSPTQDQFHLKYCPKHETQCTVLTYEFLNSRINFYILYPKICLFPREIPQAIVFLPFFFLLELKLINYPNNNQIYWQFLLFFSLSKHISIVISLHIVFFIKFLFSFFSLFNRAS